MFQHSFDDIAGSVAVLGYFLQVLGEVVGNGFGFLGVAPVEFVFQLAYQFRTHFRKVVNKVERVLNFVSNTCGEFAERGQLFLLDELGLGLLKFAVCPLNFARLRQFPVFGALAFPVN